jgi:hypothetical protein
MVLAGCSGFMVAGVCYSCNMRGINFYGSLKDFKNSIGMEDPSTIRKMEDRLRVVSNRIGEISNDPNFYGPGVMPALGSESVKLQDGIAAAKKARMKKKKK